MADQVQPIIVKKHHGGAWKVAYADFVTAMMAFFLLLWLLNVTTDEQKKGIADYFAPTSVSRSTSGSGGILGGQTMSKDGARIGDAAVPSVVVELTPPRVRKTGDAEEEPEDKEGEVENAGGEDNDEDQPNEETTATDLEDGGAETKEAANAKPTEEQLLEKMAEREQREFAQAEEQLLQALDGLPDLEGLRRHLIIDNTPEGLRIQIIDQDGRSMFPSGSAGLHDHTKKILEQVAKAVLETSNSISITGHTDSVPFRSGGDDYGNWELSSDRANASRRSLMSYGIPTDRIARVSGLAETEPLVEEDPAHPTNRRIAIVLLRQAPVLPPNTDASSQ